MHKDIQKRKEYQARWYQLNKAICNLRSRDWKRRKRAEIKNKGTVLDNTEVADPKPTYYQMHGEKMRQMSKDLYWVQKNLESFPPVPLTEEDIFFDLCKKRICSGGTTITLTEEERNRFWDTLKEKCNKRGELEYSHSHRDGGAITTWKS